MGNSRISHKKNYRKIEQTGKIRKAEKMSGQKNNVKLSQCMIVKDEEKNIRRALSWGKDIVFEQIVVDTGSADRTVELAREMGAKVFHFQWIDDFSSAKNFAIEQASGEWIAFLDADEYMSEEDARKLGQILCEIEKQEKGQEKPHFVRCAWHQIDEDGAPFAVSVQDRIFRNIPEIRYHGRIHEQIALPGGEAMICQDEQKSLSICHTGYVLSAMKEKKKWERNIRLLTREIKEEPDNGSAWSYLGDAYSGLGELEKSVEAYEKALAASSEGKISRWGRVNAGKSLLKMYANHPELAGSDEKVEQTASKAGYPMTDNPDVYFFFGLYHMKKGDCQRAYDTMRQSFQLLDVYRGDDVIYLRGSLEKAYIWMADLCQKLKIPAEELRYSVLALGKNRYLEKILCGTLLLLKKEDKNGSQTEQTWRLLTGIYHMGSLKDILFLLKIIRVVDYPSLEEKLLNFLPEEVRDRLTGKLW